MPEKPLCCETGCTTKSFARGRCADHHFALLEQFGLDGLPSGPMPVFDGPADDRWRLDAACLGGDTDLFVSTGKGEVPIGAYRVCRTCPVRRDCLDYALSLPEADDEGVWGGTSKRARSLIRRGQITPDQAITRADEQADRPTVAEQIRDEEPWLLTPSDDRPVCADCGAPPLAGGRWCLPCFDARTLPQTRTEIDEHARRRELAERKRRERRRHRQIGATA